jgi:hypothetical protein
VCVCVCVCVSAPIVAYVADLHNTGLVCKPGNLEHQILRYDSLDQPLVTLDTDLLAGKTAPVAATGAHTALRIAFELPSGSYATMLFRELQKRPSERQYQESLLERWNDREAEPQAQTQATQMQ